MRSKRRTALQRAMNRAGDEVRDAVESLASKYGKDVFDSSTKMKESIISLANESHHDMTPTQRRKALMDIVANAGLIIALDEVERGFDVIEREAEYLNRPKQSEG